MMRIAVDISEVIAHENPVPMKSILTFALCLIGVVVRAEPRIVKDVEFARVDDTVLKLDLHLPEKVVPPLIVYVHGGAWRAGSKSDMPLKGLVAKGFAVASVDYRLSTVAPFPAQAFDIKAAIRFLRAHGSEYGYDATRIVVSGSSAGGHLAALIGVTNGNSELEGTEGDCLKESSAVQGIISLFGASDLMTILTQSTPHGLSVRVPALQLLLGGQPNEKPDLARLASPVTHVDAHDPPLLLIHGDADPQMPPEQSQELKKAYEAVGRPVQLEVIHGGKHGGAEFYDAERTELMAKFLAGVGGR